MSTTNKIDDRLTPEQDLRLQVVAAEQERDYFIRQEEEARKEISCLVGELKSARVCAECWKRGVEAVLAATINAYLSPEKIRDIIKRAIKPLEIE